MLRITSNAEYNNKNEGLVSSDSLRSVRHALARFSLQVSVAWQALEDNSKKRGIS